MRATSYYLKNCMIVLETILASMIHNGVTEWKNLLQVHLPALLAALLHPKRHFDYNISYILKVKCFTEFFLGFYLYFSSYFKLWKNEVG